MPSATQNAIDRKRLAAQARGVTITIGTGYIRYCYMPGFIEAWTYDDGRQPVYAIECCPVLPRDIPIGPLTDLWTTMHDIAGYVRTEDTRGT